MTSTTSSDPGRKRTTYYPWWLDNLAEDVTGEGAAIQGTLHGLEEVRTLVLDARELYENHEFQFTGDYGDNGFLEEYTCRIQGEPTSVVVTVKRNAAGKAEQLVVNHRPRSSVLLFASPLTPHRRASSGIVPRLRRGADQRAPASMTEARAPEGLTLSCTCSASLLAALWSSTSTVRLDGSINRRWRVVSRR